MRFILVFCFALFALPALCRAGLVFERASLDAEADPCDAVFKFAFRFRNAGPETVKIADISTSCGCTRAEADRPSYAPGEEGAVLGEFEIGDRRGRQEVRIAVSSGLPGSPRTVLSLNLDIPEVLALPRRMLFWKLGSEAAPQAVRLGLSKKFGTKILEAVSESPEFSAKLLPDGEGGALLEVAPRSLAKPLKSRVRIVCKTGRGCEKVFFVHLIAM